MVRSGVGPARRRGLGQNFSWFVHLVCFCKLEWKGRSALRRKIVDTTKFRVLSMVTYSFGRMPTHPIVKALPKGTEVKVAEKLGLGGASGWQVRYFLYVLSFTCSRRVYAGGQIPRVEFVSLGRCETEQIVQSLDWGPVLQGAKDIIESNYAV